MPVKELSEYIESILEKNPFLKKEFDKKRHTTTLPEITNEAQTSAKENPRETLLSQLRMLDLDDEELRVAEYLIYEMDSNGYITKDLDEAASDLGAGLEALDKILEIIQQMDPPGIGARDTRECLQIQLKRMNKENSSEYAIVTDFLSDLAANNIDKIADELNIAKDEVSRAIDSIKKLNPRPAGSILSEKSATVIPDLIAYIKKAKIDIGINHSFLPELKFYNPYRNEADIIKEPEAREFIKNNESAAKQLIDNLKRREDTICKVASYLLTFQVDSLNKKKGDIKSLTIKDVAKALGLHPSTISRTVSHKYIQIDDKIIRLSGLLSTGMKKADGSAISKAAIKDRISKLIKSEDTAQPLGDDEIKEALRKEGIMIERRTVAKYRNVLKILPRNLRRKIKTA